jgi:hypothetical protein
MSEQPTETSGDTPPDTYQDTPGNDLDNNEPIPPWLQPYYDAADSIQTGSSGADSSSASS